MIKETIITMAMLRKGDVRVGDRILTRYTYVGLQDPDAGRAGVITDIDDDVTDGDITIKYDNGAEDALYMPGFCETAEEEENATQRIYIITGEPSSAEPLYMLLDIQYGRILWQNVTLENIQAYALADYKELGTIDHLTVVAMADVKPIKLTVAF